MWCRPMFRALVWGGLRHFTTRACQVPLSVEDLKSKAAACPLSSSDRSVPRISGKGIRLHDSIGTPRDSFDSCSSSQKGIGLPLALPCLTCPRPSAVGRVSPALCWKLRWQCESGSRLMGWGRWAGGGMMRRSSATPGHMRC
ncbi:hypothetical protein B0T11DRAFT_275999 [Plectosphaerella cucumerina]|uniref:Uncharacterized protein n=1 Tax=Plectosphaerella cucumerina TaxID=40658 RepID=A0A8K0X5F8_9PEZI|nr:hypothetical protein B0T11DRAFT_275999 [Plectosphaerella cucumerina]